MLHANSTKHIIEIDSGKTFGGAASFSNLLLNPSGPAALLTFRHLENPLYSFRFHSLKRGLFQYFKANWTSISRWWWRDVVKNRAG